MTGRFARAATAAALLACAGSSVARADDARESDRSTLRSRLGFATAQRLLASEREEDRRRGLERLGEVGTSRALRVLVSSLEPNGAARSDSERLTAVRALAEHADLPSVRHALIQTMSGVGAPDSSPMSSLARWVEASAALALARSGHQRAWSGLGKALGSAGTGAGAARQALLTYSPRALGPLVEDVPPSVALVEALEALGDQRAFGPLRSIVRRAPPEVRGRAAVALTRLGAYETVELARHWMSHDTSPVLHEAGAEILALSHADGAARAIADLLTDTSTRRAGIALALAHPGPSLVEPLSHLLRDAPADEASRILGAIGRAGSERGTSLLAGSLTRGDRHAFAAAYALALSADRRAGRALARALAHAPSRRLAARAAALRLVARGDRTEGLESAAGILMASKDPADRAAGAFTRAVDEPDQLDTLLRSRDPVVVRAAARTLVMAPESSRELAADRLANAPDGLTEAALALSLCSSGASERVPTDRLVSLIERSPAAAPLAARALSARVLPEESSRVADLLKASDPWIRAHVALGLGKNEGAHAVGLLTEQYRFEPSARVRFAIVVALGRQPNPGGERTLEMAAALDADIGVREAARAALDGGLLSIARRGHGTLWIELEPTEPGVQSVASVAESTGLVLPFVPDPDGVVAVVGTAEGPVDVRSVVYD